MKLAVVLGALAIALSTPASANLSQSTDDGVPTRYTLVLRASRVGEDYLCKNAQEVRRFLRLETFSGMPPTAESLFLLVNRATHDPDACAKRRVRFVKPLEFVDRIVRREAVFVIYRLNVLGEYDALGIFQWAPRDYYLPGIEK